MTDPDPLLATLAALDPTIADPPPEPGSPRHRLILERAMSTTEPRTDSEPERGPAPVVPVDRRVPRRARRRLLALAGGAAAAAVLAVVAVTVLGAPGDRPDPVAALTEAADATGDVDSLRVRGTYTDAEGTRTLNGEADGSDSHIVLTSPDGAAEERTVIGDQMWDDEEDGPITVTPDLVNAPYPEASRAVVRAALRGAVVEDLGSETAGGVEADHYAIELGDAGIAALGALSPTLVAQFELENPAGVTALEVWVAEDLIRRIEVETTVDMGGQVQVTRVTLEFLDLGADITIEPPG